MASLSWWFSPHPSWEPGEDWPQDVPVVRYETDAEVVLIDPFLPPGDDFHPGGKPVKVLLRIRLGDDLIKALPGSFVFIPRNTPHTWQNVGEGPSRFVATLIPGSVEFEAFFRRYAELPPGERGVEAFSRLAAQTNAVEVLGPPLAQSHL